MRNRTILFTTLLAVTIFFSCGNISDKKIRIAYANWAEGIAVTYLAKEILSEQGYRTELLNADIAPIFTSLARGKTDVFMDSWMPVTHADYFQKYDGKLEILGQIYDSARIGLVVPEYVPIHTIEELGAHTRRFSGEIVGIDAGTGIMKCTEKAIPEYGLDYRLMISSGPAMTALLKKAIDKKEWIVVTGWTPHWMFDRFRLRVLEDSRNVYGEAEQIHSIARKGFSKEHPFAAALLGNIHLSDTEISSLMRAIEETSGTETRAVRQWMDGHRDLVDSWIPEKEEGNYIPVYTSLPITITNNHKLYKYYICWVKSSLGIWIEKPGGCSSRWESPFMFTLARCRSSVSFNDGYTTIALCTWVRMHRYDLFPLFCFSHNF